MKNIGLVIYNRLKIWSEFSRGDDVDENAEQTTSREQKHGARSMTQWKEDKYLVNGSAEGYVLNALKITIKHGLNETLCRPAIKSACLCTS